MARTAVFGAIATAVLLALGGCKTSGSPASERGPAGAGALPIFGEVSVAIVGARDDQLIRVRALLPDPITGARLVLADGTKIPAYSVSAVANPSQSTDMGAALTDSATAGPDADQPFAGAMRQTTTLIGQTASVALIRVSHPADYQQAWQKAVIEVDIGFGDHLEHREFPAPPLP